MRETFQSVSYTFKEKWSTIFGTEGDQKERAKHLIELETIIYAFEKSFPNVPLTISNICSPYVVQDDLLPGCIHPEIIQVARIYFRKVANRNYIRLLLHDYMQINHHYRIYAFDEDKQAFVANTPTEFQDRKKKYYERFLSKEKVQHKKQNNLKTYIQKEDSDIGYYRSHNEKKSEEKERTTISTADLEYNVKNNEGKPKKELPLDKNGRGASFIPENWLASSYDAIENEKNVIQIKPKGDPSRLNLSLNKAELITIAQAMNKEQNKRDYVEAAESIEITPLIPGTGERDANEDYLDFSKSFSTIGLVGAGKTTLLLILTYYIVKMRDGDVGIITNRTTDTFDMVVKLRELGIDANPVLSVDSESAKDSHEEYARTIVRNAKNKGQNPLQALMENPIFEYQGSKCMLHAFDDTLEFNEKPCEKLYVKNNERKSTAHLCPLYENCGVYNTQMSLQKSKVWVGTSQALSKSGPKQFFDQQDRSYLSYMKDKMDIIFADEGDKLQETFDEAFETENNLFGEENSVFDNFVSTATYPIFGRHDLSNDAKINQFEKHLSMANSNIRFIYGLLQKSPYIRKEIKKQTFAPNQLLSKLTKHLFAIQEHENVSKHPFYQACKKDYEDEKSKNQKKPFRKINRHIKLITLEIEEIRQDISLDDSEQYQFQMQVFHKRLLERREEACKKLKSEQGMDIKEPDFSKEKVKKRWNESLELYAFYHYLASFDRLLKWIIPQLNYIQDTLNVKFQDFGQKYKKLEEFLPFIPAPPIGRSFQYRYEESRQKGKMGKVKMFQYQAIGRQVITDLQKAAEPVDGKGATVVFLSGTSYAVGSPNYHLNVPTKYALSSTAESPKINHFGHIVMDTNDFPIYVSGNQDEVMKTKALRKMTKKMIPVIKEELDYWKSHELIKNKNRRVMIVVNSYAQVHTVVEELKREFHVKVKGLINKKEKRKMEENKGIKHFDDYVSPSEVEGIASTDIDILVVPLLSINRGYNILKKEGNFSYFGSQFFFVRPYPMTNDMNYIISVLNGMVPVIIEKTVRKGKTFGDAVSYYHQESNRIFEDLVASEEGWSELDSETREIIAWYVFVNIFQMIGRSLRGNTDMRIHWVDGKFHFNSIQAFVNGREEQTMLKAWNALFEKDKSYISDQLYGLFFDDFHDVINTKIRKHQLTQKEDE